MTNGPQSRGLSLRHSGFVIPSDFVNDLRQSRRHERMNGSKPNGPAGDPQTSAEVPTRLAARASPSPSPQPSPPGSTAIEISPVARPHGQAPNLNPNRNLARLRFLEIKSKITIKSERVVHGPTACARAKGGFPGKEPGRFASQDRRHGRPSSNWRVALCTSPQLTLDCQLASR